jgi:UPF0716 protein FxsA
MLPLLLLLFIAVPIAEIYVIIRVGELIGALPTIALLIADSVLGSLLLRSQGRAVWRRFQLALSAGRPPAREVADGALVILGGALLLSPGFITDIFGLFFLLPPTRAVVRRLLARRLGGRVVAGLAGRRVRGHRRDGHRRDGAIDGTAVEVDPDPISPRRLP